MNNINTTQKIDLSGVYLWQYDSSPKLTGILKGFENLITEITVGWYNYFIEILLNINNEDTLGLDFIANFFNIKRPILSDGTSMPNSLFKKLIKGRIILNFSYHTMVDFKKYCEIAFDGSVQVKDNLDMSLEYVVSDDADEFIKSAFNESENKLAYNEVAIFPVAIRSNDKTSESMNFFVNDEQFTNPNMLYRKNYNNGFYGDNDL